MDIDGNTPTDIVEVLEYKAEIMRDKYKPVTNGREIMLEAAESISTLRRIVSELQAEVARLSQVAKY
jgi:hypothetical protein